MSINDSIETDRGIHVTDVSVDERVTFIRRTYLHLAGAIVAFILVEAILFQTVVAWRFVGFALASTTNWLINLGLFVVVGRLADRWARSEISPLQ